MSGASRFVHKVFFLIVTNFISQPPGPSIPCERRPAWLSSYRNRTANPQLPASLRLIQKRRGRILVGASELRKGFVKRILKARRKRLSGMRYRALNSYRITVAHLTRQSRHACTAPEISPTEAIGLPA